MKFQNQEAHTLSSSVEPELWPSVTFYKAKFNKFLEPQLSHQLIVYLTALCQLEILTAKKTNPS